MQRVTRGDLSADEIPAGSTHLLAPLMTALRHSFPAAARDPAGCRPRRMVVLPSPDATPLPLASSRASSTPRAPPPPTPRAAMYRASLAPHLRVARVSTGSGDASPGRASSRRRSPKRGAALVRAASSSPSTAARPASPEDWDALAPVAFASPIADALAADELLVLGTKRALLSDALARALGADDALRDAIRSVARDASPGDAGSKRTVLLPAAASEDTSAEDTTSAEDPSSPPFREVTVATLPSTSRLSRHNCPANARAAFAQLRSVPHPKDGKTLGVVTALEDPAHAVPLAAAVARAFPTYTAKSAEGRDTAEGRGRVARKGVVACTSVVVAEEASENNSADNASEANASSITSSSGPSSSCAVIASLVGSGVRLAARIVDAPPAEMDPNALVAEALRVAASARDKNSADVVADVKRFAALEAEGFGGICAVGRARRGTGASPRSCTSNSRSRPRPGEIRIVLRRRWRSSARASRSTRGAYRSSPGRACPG